MSGFSSTSRRCTRVGAIRSNSGLLPRGVTPCEPHQHRAPARAHRAVYPRAQIRRHARSSGVSGTIRCKPAHRNRGLTCQLYPPNMTLPKSSGNCAQPARPRADRHASLRASPNDQTSGRGGTDRGGWLTELGRHRYGAVFCPQSGRWNLCQAPVHRQDGPGDRHAPATELTAR